MRRISSLTKECFCWTRNQVVYSQERLEHWRGACNPETYRELLEVNQALIGSFEETLTKLVAIEFQEIAREFDIDAEQLSKRGSAFPRFQGTENELSESIIDYCTELVEDTLGALTVPAIQIADDFEEWLSELYDWYADKNN